jgi:hypothetical protein
LGFFTFPVEKFSDASPFGIFLFVNQLETRSTGPKAHVIGCAVEGRRNKAERNIQGRTTHRQAVPDYGDAAIACVLAVLNSNKD